MLYDAGSMTPEVGRRRLSPILRAKRIRRLDTLVLSHADSDHINAVPFLIRRFRIGRLVVPEAFSHEDAGRAILRLAKAHGIPIRTATAGDEIPPFGHVLHPPRGALLSDNDGSLVLRVRLGAHTALLTGDLEAPGCAMLIASGRSLEADALLLPHHGGRNPGLASLLRAVGPAARLISAGVNFPAEPVPEDAPRLRTSSAGAITVESGPAGLSLSGFRTAR